MTQREIVVRLCEAYVKAGATVEIEKIIKIADYIMSHTNDNNYSYPYQYVTYLTDTTAKLKTVENGTHNSLNSVVTSSTSDVANTTSAITDLTTSLSL